MTYEIPEPVMKQIADLFTPQDSALATRGGAWEVTELIEKVVRAAVPLILAAEQRAFEDYLNARIGDAEQNIGNYPSDKDYWSGYAMALKDVRTRARELRGEG